MIGADGAADIAAAAALSPWLTVLDLGNNPIGAEGAEAVAQIVNAQMLTELDLRGDYAGLNTIGAAGAEAIATALVGNKVLTSLRLHSNSIGPMGARFIAAAVGSSAITTLELGENEIGVQGAKA